MDWITISIVTAGSLSGFLAGASPKPTGGGLASMVGGVIVGIIAGMSQIESITSDKLESVGKLFIYFQISLIFFYIIGNLLRKHGLLKWMGLREK